MPRSRVALLLLGLLVSVTVAASCKSDGRTLRPADPSQDQSVYTPSTTSTIVGTVAGGELIPDAGGLATSTTLAALPFVLILPWTDGGTIDPKYTCNGGDVQPAISWNGAPEGAVEMALVVTDLDAGSFVHWVIGGLDPHDPQIGEGELPLGAIEGLNGFSTDATPSIGWRGPCPPAGSPHRYQFALYALDQQMELLAGSPAGDMQAVINGSAIAVAEAAGIYQTP